MAADLSRACETEQSVSPAEKTANSRRWKGIKVCALRLWMVNGVRERNPERLAKDARQSGISRFPRSPKREKHMRKNLSITGLAAVLILGMGMLSTGQKSSTASAQQKASATEVKIDNFSFPPAELTVPVGTTVTWTNRDDIPHAVVSSDDPKAFKSKVLDTGEKFTFTFSKPGAYPYFCSVHPKMVGKVVVQ
jgi:plastocyanin